MRCLGGVYIPCSAILTTLRNALPSDIRFLILGRGSLNDSTDLRTAYWGFFGKDIGYLGNKHAYINTIMKMYV